METILFKRVSPQFLFFCLLFAWWSIHPALAAEPTLPLGPLIDEAIKENPSIQAAKDRWDSSKAVISQVKTLPDPELKLGYQRIPAESPIAGAIYGFGQQIPYPGKLRLRGEVASRQADRFEQEYQARRLQIIARMKESYFDLHFVHQAIENCREE